MSSGTVQSCVNRTTGSLACLLLCVALPRTAIAESELVWIGGANGSWHKQSNWRTTDPDRDRQVPGQNDHAVFTPELVFEGDSDVTVTVDEDASAGSLAFASRSATLTSDGSRRELTTHAHDMGFENGLYGITAADTSVYVYHATLTFDNLDFRALHGGINVGGVVNGFDPPEAGILDIRNGSSVTAPRLGLYNSSEAEVIGFGSSLSFEEYVGGNSELRIKQNATADLGDVTLYDGASMILRTGAQVTALDIDSDGTLSVGGVDTSLVVNGTSLIGGGILEVKNGGLLQTGTDPTTINGAGTVSVSSDSTMDVRGPLALNGGSIVLDNSSMQTRATTINSGDVTVSGDGSMDVLGHLELNGGSVSVTESSSIATFASTIDSGEVIVSGGSLMHVQGPLELKGNTGSILVSGQLQVSQSATIGAGSELTLRDLAEMDLNGALVLDGGSVAVTGYADLTTPDIRGPDQKGLVGSLIADGLGSTIAMDANAQLAVGQRIDSPATDRVTVRNSATLSTGEGGITQVFDTGRIHVQDEGTFNLNGDLVINGGEVNSATGNLNIRPGVKINITNEGALTTQGQSLEGTTDVNVSNSSRLEFTGPVTLAGDPTSVTFEGARIDASTSGSVGAVGALHLGGTDGHGKVTAAGSGTRIEVSEAPIGKEGKAAVSRWGAGGHRGELHLANEAQGTIAGDVDLAVDDQIGTFGEVTVHTDADLSLGSLRIATAGGLVTTGRVTVQGDGSTITLSDDATLDVGHADSGRAEIHVDNGGKFVTGTGLSALRESSLLNINNGEFTFQGPTELVGSTVTVDGANSLLISATSPGASVTQRDGTTIDVNRGATAQSFGDYLLTGADTRLNADDQSALKFSGDSELTITDNAAVISENTVTAKHVTINQTGRLEAATLNVDDGKLQVHDGGSVNVGTLVLRAAPRQTDPIPGGNPPPPSVTGSTVSGANTAFQVADSLTVGRGETESNLTFTDGATVKLGDVVIAGGSTEDTIGRLNLDGANATANSLRIGAQGVAGQVGRLSLANGSAFSVQNDGPVVLGADADSSGSLTVGGGTQFLHTSSGPVRVNATGRVNVLGNMALQNGDFTVAGGQLTVGDGGRFSSPSTRSAASGLIQIDNGDVDLGVLDFAGGYIDFRAGALTYQGDLLVGPGGLMGDEFTVSSAHDLRLSGHTQIDQGHMLRIDGGHFSTGSLTAAEEDGLVLISGTWNLAGGDANLPHGFTINSQGTLSGHGVVVSPNGAEQVFANFGRVIGDSSAQRLNFQGYVSGDGTFDNVEFQGTYSPGSGPEIVSLGNVKYASSNVLLMELGGAEAATTHDELQHTGIAEIDGSLMLVTTPSYVGPVNRGDTEDLTLIRASEVVGQFAGVDFLDQLLTVDRNNYVGTNGAGTDGLFVRLDYLPQVVQLSSYLAVVGDATGDGVFNSSDLVRVFNAGEYEDGITGNSDWTEGDWDADGEFSTADLVEAFKAGTYTEAAVATTSLVPEPTSMGLAGFGVWVMLAIRRRSATTAEVGLQRRAIV